MIRVRPWLALEVVLLLVVALAAYAIGPLRADLGAAGAAPPAPTPTPSVHVGSDGLSDLHDGYRILPVTVPNRRGAALPLAFRILGTEGQADPGYEIVHTKPLHLYFIRDDHTGYQHLHPQLTGDTWRTTVRITDGGTYRAYAEFTPTGGRNPGHPVVLGLPAIVPGNTTFVPVPAPAATVTVSGGYTVTRVDGARPLPVGRPNLLNFQVTDRSGKPVAALEEYLGTTAHVSTFETRTGGLTHIHPALGTAGSVGMGAGMLTFHAQFANRGEYRQFLQFKVGGQVRQAEFTVFVT